MSWIGKILAFLVMCAAVFWVYATATAYATRTNWKVRADAYEKAYKEANDARSAEFAKFSADRDALAKEAAAARALYADQVVLTETYAKANKTNDEKRAQLAAAVEAANVQTTDFQAQRTTWDNELRSVRLQISDLLGERLNLLLDKATADRAVVGANNTAKSAQDRADLEAKKNDDLKGKLEEARNAQNGGNSLGNLGPKPPPPLPEGVRSQVDRYDPTAPDVVVLGVGLDAGVQERMVFDLTRSGPGGGYLGTVRVVQANAKDSVGLFTPVSGKPLAKLQPNELPRVGDVAGKVGRR